MGQDLMILSQVLASNYAWGVREVQRGMRLGLRAVRSENRPTFAAHLDIGWRRRSLFGRHRWSVSRNVTAPESVSWLEVTPRQFFTL